MSIQQYMKQWMRAARYGAWHIQVISRKELLSYFNSAIAYIVVVFFISFSALWLFSVQQFVLRDIADLRPYFALMPTLFIIVIPALTMRIWAEERKLGTDELLVTLPISEGALVLGKFFGVVKLLLLLLLLSVPVPILVAPLGDFEAGQIIGQYFGTFLVGASIIAVGMFISSLSTNQISAFIVSVVTLVVLSIINQINIALEPPRAISVVLEYLSIPRHFRGFEIGIIDTRDVVFYLGLMWLFLYLNTKVLHWRKHS